MDPQNPLPSAELKRNRSAAVVISEQHYCHLQLQASRASKVALIKPRSSVQGGLSLVYETSTRDDSASLAL